MANYNTLKGAIEQVIKTNGNNEITGALLQQSLLAMINSLGAGYQFAGVAVPATNPGTPDYNVFYFAGPGTYPNFNNATIPARNVGLLSYNGTWNVSSVQTTPFSAERIANDIIQLYDGTTPVYPRTRAEAVFFDNDTSKTLDQQFSQLGQELVKTGDSLGRTFIELNYITLSDQYAAVATKARIFNVTGNNCALIYVENLIGKDIVISSRQYSTYGALYVFSNLYIDNGASYGTDTFINGIADRVQVTVPEGAKWLFVNYDANYLPTISLTITEEQAKFEKEVEEYHEKNIVKLPLAIETGKYITVSSSQTLITTNEACKYLAADISVEKMSYLYIDGLRSQDPSLTMAYVIVDANGGVLASGTYSYMKIHKIVAIPSSATKIYLNVDSDYNDAYIGYFLSDKIFDYIENRAILKTNLLSPTTGYVSVTSNKVKVFENENNHYYRIPVSFLPNTTKIRITAETLASPYNLICVIGDRVGAALQYNSESGVSSYVDYEVSLPAGAYYIYINCINACTPVVKTELVDGELNGYIQDKSLNGGLFGKKCVCFGDSITWYDGQVYNWGKEEGQTAKGYESYMREVGMIVNNQGYSGANITVILSQIRATDVTGYDYVTITSGANDSRYQLPVGTLAESGSTFNENTFIGALQAGIEHVLTNNPSAKILLMTPIKGWIYYPNGYAGSAKSHVSGDGIVEKRYADAIKEVAAYYSFPVCDWYNEAGVNLLTRTWFMNDPDPDPEATPNPNDLYSLHPTTAGYKRMADILIPVLRNM